MARHRPLATIAGPGPGLGQTDTLIIGGGLAGLYLAYMLEQAGQDYYLCEARGRFGGRILTEDTSGAAADLGPAWFWPGQPRIAALMQTMGLDKFDQYADGILSFEDEQGQVQRSRGYASMEGSWRVKGGLAALTSAIARHINPGRCHIGSAVVALKRHGPGVTATLSDGSQIKAKRGVLALPPRLAADQITFEPALPPDVISVLSGIPTWMAGQAKAVAVYDKPFWRDQGLSGDAMSRRGPMVEIHDASPASGKTGALFGFIGIPAEARRDENRLRAAVLAQFERLFGTAASAPTALYIKDWANDPYTATAEDARPLRAHPAYGMPRELRGIWGGGLMFGGTEVAHEFGGFLEGALEAAQAVMREISVQDGLEPAE